MHFPFDKVRINTRDWQRSMRPWRTPRNIGISLWVVLMVILCWWWVFSWVCTERISSWESAITHAWCGSVIPEYWWQRGDLPFHVVITLVLVLVLGLGRRLMKPHWPLWTAPFGGAIIAVIDETCQLFSPTRTFEWFDLMNDSVGIVLAIGVMALARVWVRRGVEARSEL